MNASPEAFDFDAWRANYDSMTYQDHLDTYGDLWRLYPEQRHFDTSSCFRFLGMVYANRILEIGGWDGELALTILKWMGTITSWENIEICSPAVAIPIGTDSRYSAKIASNFAWVCGCFDHSADTLVMSHSAEHMRWKELQSLLAQLPNVRAIYLGSPLPEDGSNPDWRGYPGTHILEVGWDSIGAFLGGLGFRQMEAPRTHEVHCWAKPVRA